ncbi:unnamed protein product [Haemonchus placei]|uniref:Uncharacterized protein n=1 Tax=Haemonchus placei TaxID=6290 RepID=A0A3P7W988_HAEPC|nr:unnamed protein product [Haemonchus placei]
MRVNREDSVINNIDEQYNRLVEHLHDSAEKAGSLQETKRRLSWKTLELIRRRGIAEVIKEDLIEKRAVLTEAAEAGKSIRKAFQSFINYKTKMTSPCRPGGTVTASQRDEHAVNVIQRAVEKTMLGIPPYTQVQKGIRNSELRRRMKIRMPLFTPRDRKPDGQTSSRKL